MQNRPLLAQPRRRSGFTILELLVVLSIAGIIGVLSVGNISRQMQRAKARRAFQTIQNELQVAYQIAARNRRPIRIAYQPSTMTLEISSRADGTVFRKVGFGPNSGFNLRNSNIDVYPNQGVIVFPNGFATDSFSIGVDFNGYRKRVRMTRAGLVTLK